MPASGNSKASLEVSGLVGLPVTCLFTLQVVQDFQQPEGTSKEEMDAAGDGEVLVVLDLRWGHT